MLEKPRMIEQCVAAIGRALPGRGTGTQHPHVILQMPFVVERSFDLKRMIPCGNNPDAERDRKVYSGSLEYLEFQLGKWEHVLPVGGRDLPTALVPGDNARLRRRLAHDSADHGATSQMPVG